MGEGVVGGGGGGGIYIISVYTFVDHAAYVYHGYFVKTFDLPNKN